MLIDCCHLGIHVHSLEEAKIFYVDKLRLEMVQCVPAIDFFVVKIGELRMSVFASASVRDHAAATKGGGHIIFRTLCLADTIERLIQQGIEVPHVSEAPGYMKYIALRDPSGNAIGIAEYMQNWTG